MADVGKVLCGKALPATIINLTRRVVVQAVATPVKRRCSFRNMHPTREPAMKKALLLTWAIAVGLTLPRAVLAEIPAEAFAQTLGGLLTGWVGRMLLALALVLVVELAVVALYARLTRCPLMRLFIVGLVANLIWVLLVWWLVPIPHTPFFGVAAALFDGLGYVLLGRQRFADGLALGLLANAGSSCVFFVIELAMSL